MDTAFYANGHSKLNVKQYHHSCCMLQWHWTKVWQDAVRIVTECQDHAAWWHVSTLQTIHCMVTCPHTADNAAPLQHCSTCQYHSSYSEDLFLGWRCGGSEGSVAKVCEVLVKINWGGWHEQSDTETTFGDGQRADNFQGVRSLTNQNTEYG